MDEAKIDSETKPQTVTIHVEHWTEALLRFMTQFKLEVCGPMRADCYLHPRTLTVTSRIPSQPRPWWPVRMQAGFKPVQDGLSVREYLQKNIQAWVQQLVEKAQRQQEAEQVAEQMAALLPATDPAPTDASLTCEGQDEAEAPAGCPLPTRPFLLPECEPCPDCPALSALPCVYGAPAADASDPRDVPCEHNDYCTHEIACRECHFQGHAAPAEAQP